MDVAYFLHLSLSSVILIDSSTEKDVRKEDSEWRMVLGRMQVVEKVRPVVLWRDANSDER